MLIKKMIIENFRQYADKQEIIFSTDKEKNVTLILGDNGAGKTVISQAFLWCFYGETPVFQKKESLLSKTIEDEMYDGWNRQVSVSIFMEHSDIEYEISRVIQYIKQNGRIQEKNPNFSISKIDKGDTKFLAGKELRNCINEILPQELSQYFILSGEKIDSMSNDIKIGKPKDFANAVNSLLDLDFYKNAIKHLKNISKEYDISSIEGMEEDLEIINRKIETDITNLDNMKSRKIFFEKNLESFNEEIIEYQTQLKSMKSSAEIQNEIEYLENKVSEAKRNIDFFHEAGIKDFVQKMPKSFMNNSVEKVNQTLNEITSLKTDEIPERLHADLINWIEKRGECICGNKIKHGDKYFELLEKWRNIVPPESIGVLAKNMISKINDKILINSDLKEKIKNYKIQIVQRNSDIEDYEDKIETLNNKLADTEDTSILQNKLIQARENQRENQKNNDEVIAYITTLQSHLEQLKKEKSKLISSNKDGQKIIAYKNMTEKLLATFEKQIKEDENEKREVLIKSVKDAFKNIYGTSFSISIDENYKITTSNNLEKSTGQGMAVIFSFLAGLLDVLKSNKDNTNSKDKNQKLESYPLILDAPFSALDKQRITSICKVLPKVSEQIIIFIKDTDGDLAKKEMKGKIGMSYKLTKIGNSDMKTEIKREE